MTSTIAPCPIDHSEFTIELESPTTLLFLQKKKKNIK